MRVAIQQVKDGAAAAAVSAGNTALMAIARYLLKTLMALIAPAIATRNRPTPREQAPPTRCRIGANVDCSGQNTCFSLP